MEIKPSPYDTSADETPSEVNERIHLQEGTLINGVHYLLSQDVENQSRFTIEVIPWQFSKETFEMGQFSLKKIAITFRLFFK